jgi:hypothetical protein
MNQSLRIEPEGQQGCRFVTERDEVVAVLSRAPFESDLFRRDYGIVRIEPHPVHPDWLWKELAEAVCSTGAAMRYDLVEVRCPASLTCAVCFFEDRGYRLAEVQVRFLTRFKKPLSPQFELKKVLMRHAQSRDRDAILTLTDSCFTDNPEFQSRFKSTRHFQAFETRAYYRAWIENHFDTPGGLFVVAENKGVVVAYHSIRRGEVVDGLRLFHALLAGVSPEYRGQRLHLCMQHFCFNHLPEDEFLFSAATQLGNTAGIRNNIRAGRTVQNVELILLRGNA